MIAPTIQRLTGVLNDPLSARGYCDGQWSELIRLARSANLLGTLAERLSVAGIDAGPRASRHLDGARQLSRRQQRSVLWEAHQLQAALGDLQVPILLLKGAAYVMSQLPNSRGRLFGDIDILVPRDALGEVESRLMLNGWVSTKLSAYDQRYYREWMHELPPMSHIRRGTVIDVHHTILPLTARNAPDPRQIIERSLPVDGLPALRVPCPEDLVVHSLTHLAHEGELHNGLRDLCDIDSMLRRFGTQPGFWTRLQACAAGNDLALPVAFGLGLAMHCYGTPVPDGLAQALSGARRLLWQQAVFLRALSPELGDSGDPATALARWRVYLRAHALRMPWPLLVRHLTIKAWMGWRDSFKPAAGE